MPPVPAVPARAGCRHVPRCRTAGPPPVVPAVEPPVPGPPLPPPALPVVPVAAARARVPPLSTQALSRAGSGAGRPTAAVAAAAGGARTRCRTLLPVQLEPQVPPLQTSFAVHAFVQVPQWVASDATQEPLHSSSPEGHLHWLAWQVWPPRQGMPQPPQLSGSDAVFRHCVPQAVWPEGQLTVPPVPVAPLPAVPGLPLVDGLEQAAAKMTKQSPKSETRPVFIVIRIPGETS